MILFVDDERRDNTSYVEELNDEGYQVEFINSADQALNFLNEKGGEVELLILDIMMPPGERLKGFDTEDGVRTGEYFYETVRNKFPALKVIILTNHPGNGLAEKFKSDKLCQFCRKSDCLPYQLAEIVEIVSKVVEVDK